MAKMKKFELEYIINCSNLILFEMISTPSGLSEWFADNVNIKNDIYTFILDGSEEKARMLGKKFGEFVKFHWLEHQDESTYLELRIKIDPLTNDVALYITDFGEDEDDIEEMIDLWENQVHELIKRVGG
jgi:hypothetical protein